MINSLQLVWEETCCDSKMCEIMWKVKPCMPATMVGMCATSWRFLVVLLLPLLHAVQWATNHFCCYMVLVSAALCVFAYHCLCFYGSCQADIFVSGIYWKLNEALWTAWLIKDFNSIVCSKRVRYWLRTFFVECWTLHLHWHESSRVISVVGSFNDCL